MTDKGLHNVRSAEFALFFDGTTLMAKLLITWHDQTIGRHVFADVSKAVRDCQDWIDDTAQKNPDMTAQQAITAGLYKFWRDGEKVIDEMVDLEAKARAGKIMGALY